MFEEIGASGLALTIAVTSAIKVDNTSWVRCEGLVCLSMEFSMCLEMPIIHSQAPTMWEELG